VFVLSFVFLIHEQRITHREASRRIMLGETILKSIVVPSGAILLDRIKSLCEQKHTLSHLYIVNTYRQVRAIIE
jgi:hypothetical protein